MAEPTHAVIVRMPIGLHRRLVALAERERRPVGAQALYLLARALEQVERQRSA